MKRLVFFLLFGLLMPCAVALTALGEARLEVFLVCLRWFILLLVRCLGLGVGGLMYLVLGCLWVSVILS